MLARLILFSSICMFLAACPNPNRFIYFVQGPKPAKQANLGPSSDVRVKVGGVGYFSSTTDMYYLIIRTKTKVISTAALRVDPFRVSVWLGSTQMEINPSNTLVQDSTSKSWSTDIVFQIPIKLDYMQNRDTSLYHPIPLKITFEDFLVVNGESILFDTLIAMDIQYTQVLSD